MGASGHDCALTKRARGNKTSVGVSEIGGERLFLMENHPQQQGKLSTEWFIVPAISLGQQVVRSSQGFTGYLGFISRVGD